MTDEIKQTIVIEAQTHQDPAGSQDPRRGQHSRISIRNWSFGLPPWVAFGKEVIDEDLSQKTGVSGQALSALKLIAEQSSSSIEDFATGVTRLLRNLADSSAAGDKAQTPSRLGVFFPATQRIHGPTPRSSSATLQRSLPRSTIRPSAPPLPSMSSPLTMVAAEERASAQNVALALLKKPSRKPEFLISKVSKWNTRLKNVEHYRALRDGRRGQKREQESLNPSAPRLPELPI